MSKYRLFFSKTSKKQEQKYSLLLHFKLLETSLKRKSALSRPLILPIVPYLFFNIQKISGFSINFHDICQTFCTFKQKFICSVKNT